MVSFCIKLYTMNFCNIKTHTTKMSIRRYLQTLSTAAGLPSSWMCMAPVKFTCLIHGNGGKPCSIDIIFLTPTGDHRHFV